MSSKHLALSSSVERGTPGARLRATRLLRQLPTYLLLVLLSVPFVFPFLWMLASSLKGQAEIFAFPPQLLPAAPRWENFVEVFRYQPFARHYVNSLYIAVLVTAGTVLVAAMAGYAFARVRFPGRNLVFTLLLAALIMPAEVTIIPNFLLMKQLGLSNSHLPLILLPVLGAEGVIGTFLMRQFFLNLPREIEESAMLDGLGRFGIFWRIALPIAQPAAGALAVLAFLGSWNAFLEPLVFIDDLNLFTLPLSLRNFTDSYGLPVWNLQLAATSLAVLPILLVYIVAQRFIVASFALSGVKG
jgi:multiple sugar transport system permease protein